MVAHRGDAGRVQLSENSSQHVTCLTLEMAEAPCWALYLSSSPNLLINIWKTLRCVSITPLLNAYNYGQLGIAEQGRLLTSPFPICNSYDERYVHFVLQVSSIPLVSVMLTLIHNTLFRGHRGLIGHTIGRVCVLSVRPGAYLFCCM